MTRFDMDYKKEYDDICQKLMSAYNTTSFVEVRKAIEGIHPELCESEDERIRKRLIEYFEGFRMGNAEVRWEGLIVQEVLAWLEKQKEQKHPDGCFTCDEYKKGYEEGRRNGFTAGYNKAIKEVEHKEQRPAEWNANDKAFIKDCAHILDENGYEASTERLLSMFPVKPAEWSEEEKTIIDCAVEVVEKAGLPSLAASLKSLRPSWKPSEEQMRALYEAAQEAAIDREDGNALYQLYEQLKKL